jgi:hypothetical protein
MGSKICFGSIFLPPLRGAARQLRKEKRAKELRPHF